MASYIAKAINAHDANLICYARWTSLKGRELVQENWNHVRYPLGGTVRALQSELAVSQSVAVAALPSALPEVVFAMISPLLELFNLFQVGKHSLAKELEYMQSRNF